MTIPNVRQAYARPQLYGLPSRQVCLQGLARRQAERYATITSPVFSSDTQDRFVNTQGHFVRRGCAPSLAHGLGRYLMSHGQVGIGRFLLDYNPRRVALAYHAFDRFLDYQATIPQIEGAFVAFMESLFPDRRPIRSTDLPARDRGEAIGTGAVSKTLGLRQRMRLPFDEELEVACDILQSGNLLKASEMWEIDVATVARKIMEARPPSWLVLLKSWLFAFTGAQGK